MYGKSLIGDYRLAVMALEASMARGVALINCPQLANREAGLMYMPKFRGANLVCGLS